MTTDITLRSAVEADVEALGDAYLAAFGDEAVITWVLGPSAHAEDVEAGFADGMLQRMLSEDETLLAVTDSGRIAGISIWRVLDSADSPRAEAAQLAEASAQSPVFKRFATVMGLVAQRHPDQSHLYLVSMGVVADRRGQGIGAAMLRHRLGQADQAGLPAYLEASTSRSCDLYARHGFVELEPEIVVPNGGPHVRPMWREVVSGRSA